MCHHVAGVFLAVFSMSYVVGIWKRCIDRNPEIAESQNYGWTAERRIQWVEGMFPEILSEILIYSEYDEEEFSFDILENFYSNRLYYYIIIL